MIIVRSVALSFVLIAAGYASAEAQIYVYPQRGQSPAQQQADERACYDSAIRQSGYVPGQSGQVGRSALGGAARGALGGAIIGGISGGSAGKGAGAGALLGGITGTARGSRREARAQDNWRRAFTACIEARGYVAR